MEVNIGDIVPASTLDWPGKAVMVVFMRGCPLRCPYCSNARLMDVPEGFEATAIEAIDARILDAAKFIDGVVFSGGEPFMQPAALNELAAYARGLGLLVGVHTNGVYPERIEGMANAGLLDAVFLDIKASLEYGPYQTAGGAMEARTFEAIGRSMAVCSSLRKNNEIRFLEVRTTVFRGIGDTPEAIGKIAAAIERADAYAIQQGRPEVAADEKIKAIDAVPRKELLDLAAVAREAVRDVEVVKVRTHAFGDEIVS